MSSNESILKERLLAVYPALDCPVMKESNKGKAQGTPMSLAGAPCVQVEVCDSGCGSAAGVVSGTPDQPWLPTAPDVHVCGG